MEEMMQRMNRRRSIMEGVEPVVQQKTKAQLFNSTAEGASESDSDSENEKPKITNLSSLSAPKIRNGGSSGGSSDSSDGEWESD